MLLDASSFEYNVKCGAGVRDVMSILFLLTGYISKDVRSEILTKNYKNDQFG